MWKVVVLFWVVLAPTLAGILLLAVLMVPALQMEAGKWILIAAITGFVIAIPVSWGAAQMYASKSA